MQRGIVTSLVIVGAIFGMIWFYPVQRAQIMEVAGPKMYTDRAFAAVEKKSGIEYKRAPAYKTGQMTSLKLDVYQPEGDKRTSRPAIIFVHGGGFGGGNRGIYDEESKGGLFGWGKYFAERGYVVFSIDYRVGDHLYKLDDPDLREVVNMAVSDALTSVKWVRQHSDEYSIDPEKIAIGGNSAGAIIALYSAYNPTGDDEKVSTVISLAGTLKPDDLGVIDGSSVPAIMFAGTSDATVPYVWSLATKERLVASRVRVDWYSYPGAGHEVAGYTQVAPQIASFLYSAMRLDGSVVQAATPSVVPTIKPDTQVVSLKPTPVVIPTPNTTAAAVLVQPIQTPTQTPTQTTQPVMKEEVVTSPEPSRLVSSIKTIPVAVSPKSMNVSPVVEVELERMPPADFVWEAQPVEPVFESSDTQVEDTPSFWELLLEKIENLVENLS